MLIDRIIPIRLFFHAIGTKPAVSDTSTQVGKSPKNRVCFFSNCLMLAANFMKTGKKQTVGDG